MPRIVCISDTHTKIPAHPVPDGDILIHAGDYSFRGTPEETIKFNQWLGTLPHKHKVIIAGNHDWIFEQVPDLGKALITNAVYLHHSWAVVDGIRIFGSPFTPEFCDWAFNLPRGEKLKEKWDQIPDGIDVLVTHGPPAGIRDLTWDGQPVGCKDLMDAILRIRPQLHVFGHIHEGYGVTHFDGITFVNAAICDDRYWPINPPIVIDL